ncbi:MAG: carbohydrate porin [Nitrospirales bacterium]
MRRTILQSLGGWLLLLCVDPAVANSEESQRIESLHEMREQWKAVQSTMKDHGVRLDIVNTVDVLSNVSGGIRKKTATVGDLDLLLTIDMNKLIDDWKGTLFVYGLGTYGDDPGKHVGDIQAVSSIAGPNTWKLFEAWYQQNFFERFSLLAGLYDMTSEFDVMVSASELFVNASFGTGAEFAISGKSGPSTFPATALGIRGQAIVNDSLMVRAVLADGVPGNPNDTDGTHILINEDDGLFSALELAYYQFRPADTPDTKREILAGKPRRLTFRRVGRSAPHEYEAKVALGLWGYTTKLEHLSKVDNAGVPAKRDGTYGLYGLAEYDIYHEPGDTDQELTLFGRAGMADPKANRFSQYYGGGFVYTGLLPGRQFDQTGLGVAAAINGKYYKRSQRNAGQSVDTAEITLEATHAFFVNPDLIIQPDVQYVINPGTVPGRKNALVLGARLEVNFNWFNP